MSKAIRLAAAVLLGPVPASAQVHEAWVARYDAAGRYDQARDLALDPAGNVYVTGRSPGSTTGDDFGTVKYDSAGVEQWVARYNGPTGSVDQANALALGPDGSVCVTGYSIDTATSRSDYATVKYDSGGNEQWVAGYNGPIGSSDQANAIAVDEAGNVYVTGLSGGIDLDYATVKYDSAGVQQWAARYNGPGNYSDVANAIAVDDSGNVYVTGVSAGTGSDYATVKYDAAGAEQWVRRYDGPAAGYDEAMAIAVDDSGNVYVTGPGTGSGTGTDCVTVKYDAAGTEQWVARYNGPGNYSDGANAIVLDSAGVYVAGYSTGDGTEYDYLTVRYDTAGAEQWARSYNGPANDYDEANAVALGPDGSVYVTGYSRGDVNRDYATVSYSPDGNEQWVMRYDGPANHYDAAVAIAVDGAGCAYVTGQSRGDGTGDDYATVKYSPDVGVETGEPVAHRPVLSVTPNPAAGGLVTVRAAGLQCVPRPVVRVVDAAGRCVLTRRLPGDDGASGARLDIRGLSSGIYLVRVEARAFSASRKLVVGRGAGSCR